MTHANSQNYDQQFSPLVLFFWAYCFYKLMFDMIVSMQSDEERLRLANELCDLKQSLSGLRAQVESNPLCALDVKTQFKLAKQELSLNRKTLKSLEKPWCHICQSYGFCGCESMCRCKGKGNRYRKPSKCNCPDVCRNKTRKEKIKQCEHRCSALQKTIKHLTKMEQDASSSFERQSELNQKIRELESRASSMNEALELWSQNRNLLQNITFSQLLRLISVELEIESCDCSTLSTGDVVSPHLERIFFLVRVGVERKIGWPPFWRTKCYVLAKSNQLVRNLIGAVSKSNSRSELLNLSLQRWNNTTTLQGLSQSAISHYQPGLVEMDRTIFYSSDLLSDQSINLQEVAIHYLRSIYCILLECVIPMPHELVELILSYNVHSTFLEFITCQKWQKQHQISERLSIFTEINQKLAQEDEKSVGSTKSVRKQVSNICKWFVFLLMRPEDPQAELLNWTNSATLALHFLIQSASRLKPKTTRLMQFERDLISMCLRLFPYHHLMAENASKLVGLSQVMLAEKLAWIKQTKKRSMKNVWHWIKQRARCQFGNESTFSLFDFTDSDQQIVQNLLNVLNTAQSTPQDEMKHSEQSILLPNDKLQLPVDSRGQKCNPFNNACRALLAFYFFEPETECLTHIKSEFARLLYKCKFAFCRSCGITH